MKQNHLLATFKTFLLLSAGVLLASCAQDGFDEESFNGTYPGFELTKPDAATIIVKPSSDKQSQTITWDAVEGAGTYTVSVYLGDAQDACTNEVVKDQVVRVNYITVPRVDKTYYSMTIKVNDNVPESNTAPEGVTEFSWNTFTIDVATIPGGTDLSQYFKENPIPVGYQGSDITYTLEAGAEYTVDTLDVDGYIFNLVSDENNHAKVKFTGAHATIVTGSGLTLKNIDFECSASDAAFITLAKKPKATPIAANLWNTDYDLYLIEEPIAVINCNVDNLNSFFLTDVKFTYFPATILVDNCVVHLTTSANNTENAYFYFYTKGAGGFAKDLTVKNSTFYNTTDFGFRYFVRYGGFSLDNVKDYFGWEKNTIAYENCTFYNVCQNEGQWGNYNGIYRATTSYWVMTRCIFWNCSTSGSVPRRFLQGKGDRGETATFLYNTYMASDGTFQDPQNYDQSGTNIEEDPKFANPANGDFHISASSKQAELHTGDPRWLP
ncbi:MAG: DUF4957 domain-containing protein [Prevotella sp.]|nr:DUF4957 domain-containing protein [Prevotella sp.]